MNLYKILLQLKKNLIILDTKHTVDVPRQRTRYGKKHTVDVPRPRTRYGKKSVSYEAATLWNSLPNHVRSFSTFGQFNIFISNWYFSENCTFSSCKL